MALVKISNISVDKSSNAALSKGYLYKDLLLPIKNRVSYNNQLKRNVELRDIQGLFDIEAVRQSIVNCFLTSPGQKILSPEFGIDLRRHIFEPIDDWTHMAIEEEIKDKLPGLEPRIQLQSVTVEPDIDEQEYNITLQINVPSLNVYGLSLKSVLNSNGYFIS